VRQEQSAAREGATPGTARHTENTAADECGSDSLPPPEARPLALVLASGPAMSVFERGHVRGDPRLLEELRSTLYLVTVQEGGEAYLVPADTRERLLYVVRQLVEALRQDTPAFLLQFSCSEEIRLACMAAAGVRAEAA
jgi:hypothetical protein